MGQDGNYIILFPRKRQIIFLLLFLSFSMNIISCGFEDSLPCVDDCEETNEEEQEDDKNG